MFSPIEQKIIKSVGRRPQSLKKVTTKVYAHKKRPMDANNTIAQAVRRINKKCEYHRLDWFINGAGGGRGGKTVWKDKMP